MAELTEPLRFRPASGADFAAISRLAACPRDLFLAFPTARYPLTPRQLRRLTEERSDLVVAEYGMTVVGFADLYQTQPAQYAFIGNLIVAVQYRGKGIGRGLIRHMLGLIFCRDQLPQARISVFRDNTRARALYEELGFDTYASETHLGRDGRLHTLLHMQMEMQRFADECNP